MASRSTYVFARTPTSTLRSLARSLVALVSHVALHVQLELSTRPEKKFMGEIEDWNRAEKQLEAALNASGFKWKLNPGDGAFYGPKIDIHITDAMGRSHQCATIQLDFQLPKNFGLEYSSESGVERPVIIHRAIYGSFERFIAILTEHLAGKWYVVAGHSRPRSFAHSLTHSLIPRLQ